MLAENSLNSFLNASSEENSTLERKTAYYVGYGEVEKF